MNIKIKRMGASKLPHYAHPGDAGMDVHAMRDYGLHPGERIVLPLGFAMEFPDGFVALMFDKSSLPKNGGLHVIGGVFDSGYRGEYNVQIINLGSQPYKICAGDKVAQIIIMPICIATFEEVLELSSTSRGVGGFGSTGK